MKISRRLFFKKSAQVAAISITPWWSKLLVAKPKIINPSLEINGEEITIMENSFSYSEGGFLVSQEMNDKIIQSLHTNSPFRRQNVIESN